MKKIFFTLCMFLLTVSFTELQAQCAITAGVPYGTGEAPTSSGGAVSTSVGSYGPCNWLVERNTVTNVVNATTYELSLDTGDAATYVTVYNAAGFLVTSGLLTTTPVVNLSFTANDSGTYTLVLSASGTDCTTAENLCRNVLISCTSCTASVCGNAACEAGEDYCNCPGDCDCADFTNPVFLYLDTTVDPGQFFGDTSPTLSFPGVLGPTFCPDQVTGNPNTGDTLYVAVGAFGPACVPDWLATPSQGIITTNGVTPSDTISNATVYFLCVTQADIDASLGTTTITLVNPDDAGCMDVLTINWADFGTAATLVNDLCGCSAPGGTVEYDCATSSVQLTITDIGAPAGTYTATPSVGTPILIDTLGTYSFPAPIQDSTYSISITEASGNCDIFITGIYPACMTIAAGCTDSLLLDGGLDSIPTQNWIEVSDTNAVATNFPNISNDVVLAGTGSAWLGGWGGATTTSVTSIAQTVTFPSGTATLSFWALLGTCDSAADIASVLVDGVVVWTTNGADAQCGTDTWNKHVINMDAYADGAAHTITIQLTEAGTNGGATNFFVDEIMLETCATDNCPPTLVVSGAIEDPTNDLREAEQNVTSDAVISNTDFADDNITFQAGTDIDLNPGFEVGTNIAFCARIAACGTPLRMANSKGNMAKAKALTKHKTKTQATKNQSRRAHEKLRIMNGLKY